MVCYENNTFLAWVVVIIIILLILLFVWAINRVAERKPIEVNYTFTFINKSTLPANLTVVDSKSGFIYFKGNVAENDRAEVINPATAVNIDFLNNVDPQNSVIRNNLTIKDNVRWEIRDSSKGGGITINSYVTDHLNNINDCISPKPDIEITEIKIVNKSGSDLYYTLGLNYKVSVTSDYLQTVYNTEALSSGVDNTINFGKNGNASKLNDAINYYNTPSGAPIQKNLYTVSVIFCSEPKVILGAQASSSSITINNKGPFTTPSGLFELYIKTLELDPSNPPTFIWNGTSLTGDNSTGAYVVGQ